LGGSARYRDTVHPCFRDLVSGVSPAFAYVELKEELAVKEAIAVLNGGKLRNHRLTVKEAPSSMVADASNMSYRKTA